MVKLRRRDRGRRVVRIVDDHQGSFFGDLGRDRVEVDDIAVFRRHRHVIDLRAGELRPVDKGGIARIRHKHIIARIDDRHRNVRKALLRARERDDLASRIERHAVAALVPRRDRVEKHRMILDRVDVVFLFCGFCKKHVDDLLRRRNIRRADREVDDLEALFQALGLDVCELDKDARIKPIHSFCEFHDEFLHDAAETAAYNFHRPV